MAVAVAHQPISVPEPLIDPVTAPVTKSLRFPQKPWADTKRVSILTGAERDDTIAQDITQLIGKTPTDTAMSEIKASISSNSQTLWHTNTHLSTTHPQATWSWSHRSHTFAGAALPHLPWTCQDCRQA